MLLHVAFSFEAAHWLPDHPLCGQVHGHRYEAVAVVEGPLGSDGFVLDFHELATVVDMLKRKYLDHKLLNESLPVRPTAELISLFIFDQLVQGLETRSPVEVTEVTVFETEKYGATCTREDWEQHREELRHLVVSQECIVTP